MSVCGTIKSFALRHEWVGDLFSVLAVSLLFGTVWTILEYNTLFLTWIQENLILHIPLAIIVVVLDVFLIFVFLSLGASRSGPADQGCFHTFKGRRHGGASLYGAFNSWLHHMEHVGKKHR